MTKVMDCSSAEGLRRAIMLGLLPALLFAMLAACSGGGGGGGGSGSSGNGLSDNPAASFLASAAEPTAPFAATDWSASQEYLNSTGLSQLKAAEGYARRTGGLPGGQGVRIAIIDSGIDLTHADLGNLAAKSWSAGGEALAGASHGTFVAGIAAASRTQSGDSNDMHGVAYKATLVNFQASRPSTGTTSFASADLVDALNMASGLSSGSASVESDVINLSLGAFSTSDSTFSSLKNAMIAAAAESKIMVLAAGNEGLDADATRKLQPIYPAAYADDAGIAGLAIVVGNLTSSNQAAPSSNLCGDTKNFCLFAPGTSIRSTLNGGGYGIGSGTSFAAPYVSGAAAVVKAAFPGVSSTDVVNRLLLTATDLGDPGVDNTFGRGLLDLEAAMAPVGPVGVITGPTIDGPITSLSNTSLDLGPAWSIGAAGQALLDKAVGFDAMGFPFPVDLGERVISSGRTSGLEQFVGIDRTSSAGAFLPVASLMVSIADQSGTSLERGNDPTVLLAEGEAERPTPKLALRTEPFPDVTLFASLNGSSQSGLGLREALAERQLGVFETGLTVAPFDDLSGEVSGAGLVWSAGDGFDVAISAFASLADDQARETAMQKIDIAKSVGDHIELRLALGLLQEDDGFFGANASGAFGDELDSRSQFADVSIVAALSDRVDWFGSYSRGRSSIDGRDDALLGGWSSAGGEAFATGMAISDVGSPGDSLSLMVGQPFRGDGAEATLTVPVGRTPEGAVVSEQQRVSLEPPSREIVSNIVYRRSFGQDDGQEIGVGGFSRFNPGHNADNPPEFGIGLRYRWRF